MRERERKTSVTINTYTERINGISLKEQMNRVVVREEPATKPVIEEVTREEINSIIEDDISSLVEPVEVEANEEVEAPVEVELSRDELKEALRELEIEFKGNAKTEVLRELYKSRGVK